MISPTAWMLTKRRAVDFCHVATAICSPAALTKRRAVDFCHVATAICSPAALP